MEQKFVNRCRTPIRYPVPVSVDEYILPSLGPMTLEVPEVVSLDVRPFKFVFVGTTLPEIVIRPENIQRFNTELNNVLYLNSVLKLEGLSYKLGANGPDKYDCSSVVCYRAEEVTGIPRHRTAKKSYKNFFIESSGKPKPGMVTFYDWNGDGTIQHVTTFISPNEVLHPSVGKGLILRMSWPAHWIKSDHPNAKIYHGNLDWNKLFEK